MYTLLKFHSGRYVFLMTIRVQDQSVPQARGGCSNGPYLDSFPLPCHCQGGGRGG